MRKVGLLLCSIILISSLASFAFGADRSFIAHLSGDQHTPSVETLGRGQAVFHLDEDGVEMSYKIIIDNTSNITMSHIHMAPAGQNGPVLVWLYPDAPPPVPISGVFDGVLAEGTITESELTGDLAGQSLSSLLDIMETGGTYVNVHTEQNPGGELRGQIMAAPSAMFKVTIENISETPEFPSSGVFNTPDGAAGPGPLEPGGSYKFSLGATPGSMLSLATMFVQSNDLFYAPDESGIPLFNPDGTPINGDVTSQIMLWDAGTEVNQEPGIGLDQAPRQAGANTGADENGVVQIVNDGFTYPNTADILRITATPVSDTQLEISIENISTDASFLLAPGVWVVHTDDSPLFTAGQPDRGEGLEALAEDGDPSGLGSAVESRTGAPVILAPGVWAVHIEDAPLFTTGQPDRDEGLEALAEDGDPSGLAPALNSKLGVISSGVFNTPAGAAEPGPVLPGGSYEFYFSAFPGSNLSFATMFVQSNDVFYAPDEMGIAVFNAFGGAMSGDITSQIMLWDAGTEVNQQPGIGPDQAPRQAGANTGADENGNVQIVNDGYSYPDTAEAIRVSISMVPPEEPSKDYSNTFFVNLPAGLNMISLPLEAINPLTARSFIDMVDSTVVIKYDTQGRRFSGFTPNMEGNGFSIEGGQGYIINRMTDGVVTFVGAAWENIPSTNAAPPIADRNSAWAFAVTGRLDSVSGDYDVSESYTLVVRNLRTGELTTDSVSQGRSFAAVFADLNRNPVVQTGDTLEIIVTDSAGEIAAGPIVHQISSDDIRRAFSDTIIRFGRIAPKKTVLLQNYPNPFNPETWIPYNLAETANVSVRIYSSSGRLVRLLDLGHRDAGAYTRKRESAYWDGRNDAGEHVSSGVYFYTMEAGPFISTRKMTILK